MTGAVLAAMGARGVVHSLPTAASDVSAGVSAVATLNMNSAGTFSCVGNTLGTTQSGNWVFPTGWAPGSYTIRMHVDGGVTPAGPAMDTDHALSSNRVWSVTRASVGTDSANVTLTLKNGGVTVLSQAFTFTANRAS